MSITLASSTHNLLVDAVMKSYLFNVLLLCIASVLIQGCNDPCYELSKRVCFCEDGELAQQACIERLDLRENNGTPSSEQQESCQELLDTTCTEEAVCRLIEEDPAACGLALSDDNG